MTPRRPPRVALLPRIGLLLGFLLLQACGGLGGGERETVEPPREIDEQAVRSPVPKPEPLSKYGNPESYEVFGQRYVVMTDAHGYVERGIASWYGPDFHGKRASSGEPYDMYKMTAAHKTLPIPCYVLVTNLQNGRRAILKVNDRGPFKDNRIIDLSYIAARKLGIWQQGTGLVEVRVLDEGHPIVPPGRALVRRPPPEVDASPPVAVRDIPPRAPLPPPVPPGAAVSAAPTTLPAAPATAPARVPPYYLQLGAFAERANAEGLRARLQPQIPNVQVTPAESAGQAVYRVQVGPFTTVESSDRIVETLHRLGVSHHRIVVD